MARSIHPLLADDVQSGTLTTRMLTNGTFEAGLELPLLDAEFDVGEEDDVLAEPNNVPAHLFGGHLEWQAYE